MSAVFRGTALFIWTRHRFVIVATAAAYLLVAFTFDAAWASADKQYAMPMLSFLGAAPFFLPLIMCSTTANTATADLATGESWYPAHFLRMPLTAPQLAAAFMASAAGLFIGLTALGFFLSNGLTLVSGRPNVPIEARTVQLWRPFLSLALLVWIQALIWRPFRRGWLRIGLLLTAVVAYFGALIFAIASGVPAALLVAGALVQVPLAYFVAVRGIAEARAGAPDSSPAPIDGTQATRASGFRRRSAADHPPFRSAFAAQTWFESKVQRTRAGVTATFVVPIILFFTVMMSAVGKGHVSEAVMHDAAALAASTLLFSTLFLMTMLTGPAFATFETTAQGFNNDAMRMPTFFAALPLSTGQFAWAKLRAAARRMGLIAVGVIAATIVVCALIGVPDSWAQPFAASRAQHGELAAYALLGLAGAAFVAFVASSTANVVWIGLLGRHLQTAMGVIVVIVAGISLAPALLRGHPERAQVAAEIISWLLPALAVLKICLLALLMYVVGSRRLYSWSRIASIGTCWASAVAVCSTLYALHSATSELSSLTDMVTTIVLLTPGLGIVGAPLALQGNRTR